MNSLSKFFRERKKMNENHAYKIGKPVNGVKAIVPAENGKEEPGLVVYKRKAIYKFNG